jgi:hypothetical protein
MSRETFKEQVQPESPQAFPKRKRQPRVVGNGRRKKKPTQQEPILSQRGAPAERQWP